MKEETIKSIKYLNENEITTLDIEVPQYLKSLDSKQQIAATNIDGNFLVIAGPGSGKTHTMVYRVAYMLEQGIDPKEICIITFTKKSANEMKYRISELMPGIELGFVGTFHGLGNLIITKNYTPHRKNFRLIDPQDDIEIIKLVKATYDIKFNNKIRASTI